MHPLVLEVTFARVESPFNSDTVGRVKAQLAPLLSRTGHVVLDLREATLDGVGLSAVLSMQRQLELQDRRLFVVATDPRFLSLLEVTGTHGALVLFADPDQAMDCARSCNMHAMAA